MFDPAFPGGSLGAGTSSVLSHQTPIGWNPKVRLNVAAAFSFSLWLIMTVASTSSTIRPASRSAPAVRLAGTPPASCDQTCRRARARAGRSFFNRPGVTSSSVRHTVGAEAIGPNAAPW